MGGPELIFNDRSKTDAMRCNFHWNLQKILHKNLIYVINGLVCLGIPKSCIVGYSSTRPYKLRVVQLVLKSRKSRIFNEY